MVALIRFMLIIYLTEERRPITQQQYNDDTNLDGQGQTNHLAYHEARFAGLGPTPSPIWILFKPQAWRQRAHPPPRI